MSLLEAKRWSVARNENNQLGLIYSSDKVTTMTAHYWPGYLIGDDNRLPSDNLDDYDSWESEFPDVLFHLDPKIIFSGYHDHVNSQNVNRYLEFYFKVEEFKVKFNGENKVNLLNVFPLIMHLESDISYDEFSQQMKTILGERYKAHVQHCCASHGCKYGNNDCPVASRLVEQAYPCESCDDDKEELNYLHQEFSEIGDSNFIENIKNDKSFMFKLKALRERGVDLNHFIKINT